MVRRLSLVMTVLLAAGCVTVSGDPASAPPSPGSSVSATASITTQPTATPQPIATDEPERTLAPGETPAGSPLDIGEMLASKLSVVNLTDSQVVVSVDFFN